MNNVVIAGNLNKNPEIRKTKNGTSVSNFRVCVNEDYTNKDGEKVKQTTYVDVEAWGWLADNLSNITTKDKVVVVGSLKSFVREEGGKSEVCVKALNISVVPYNKIKSPKQASSEELEVVGTSSGSDIPF